MNPFERIGKTVVALVVSAAAGLILGISFYMRRESFGYQYPWGSFSPELRVLDALQFGLVCGAALGVFLFRKIHLLPGRLYLLLILLAPALLTAYFLHSATWLMVIPLVMIAVAVLIAVIPEGSGRLQLNSLQTSLRDICSGQRANGIGMTSRQSRWPTNVLSESVGSFRGSIPIL